MNEASQIVILEQDEAMIAITSREQSGFLWGNNVKEPGSAGLYGWEARKRMLNKLLGDILLDANRLIAEIREVSADFKFNSQSEVIPWWNSIIKQIQDLLVRVNLILETGNISIAVRERIEKNVDRIGTLICYGEAFILFEDLALIDGDSGFVKVLQEKVVPPIEQLGWDLSKVVAGSLK